MSGLKNRKDMGQYLHKYDSLSAFTEDYNGEAYHEPWVSLVDENEHVDYNKPPFYGEGFVFDAAQIRRVNEEGLGYNVGMLTMKMIHADESIMTTEEARTISVGGRKTVGENLYMYKLSHNKADEFFNGPAPTIKIINARSIGFDTDEVEITFNGSAEGSCYMDKVGLYDDSEFRLNWFLCALTDDSLWSDPDPVCPFVLNCGYDRT